MNGNVQNTAISPLLEHRSDTLSQEVLMESLQKREPQKQTIVAQRVTILKDFVFLPVTVFTSQN